MQAIATARGIHPHRWLGQYSGWAHLELQLRMLLRVPVRDWVVVARVDEFLAPLPEGSSLAAVAVATAAEGASWVGGVVWDGVPRDGQLATMRSVQPSEFPLRCRLFAAPEDSPELVVMFQVR